MERSGSFQVETVVRKLGGAVSEIDMSCLINLFFFRYSAVVALDFACLVGVYGVYIDYGLQDKWSSEVFSGV